MSPLFALALILLAPEPEAVGRGASDPPPAGAQVPPLPKAPTGSEPPPRAEARILFISPAGEPFRGLPSRPYPVADWFSGADANRDGALTNTEFVADSLRFFDTLDTDRDGRLDGFEIDDYERKIAPEILPSADRGGPMMTRDTGPRVIGDRVFVGPRPKAYGTTRQGAGLFGLINEVQPVAGQDRDLDRRISREEATYAARDRFTILDEDRDGRLYLAALPKTPMQEVAERGPDRPRKEKPAPPKTKGGRPPG